MAHLLAKSWEEWEFQRSRVATCIVTVPCASDSLLACAQPSTWQGKPKNVASHLHSKLCRRPCQPHVAFITATLLAHFIAHVHTAANADVQSKGVASPSSMRCHTARVCSKPSQYLGQETGSRHPMPRHQHSKSTPRPASSSRPRQRLYYLCTTPTQPLLPQQAAVRPA